MQNLASSDSSNVEPAGYSPKRGHQNGDDKNDTTTPPDDDEEYVPYTAVGSHEDIRHLSKHFSVKELLSTIEGRGDSVVDISSTTSSSPPAVKSKPVAKPRKAIPSVLKEGGQASCSDDEITKNNRSDSSQGDADAISTDVAKETPPKKASKPTLLPRPKSTYSRASSPQTGEGSTQQAATVGGVGGKQRMTTPPPKVLPKPKSPLTKKPPKASPKTTTKGVSSNTPDSATHTYTNVTGDFPVSSSANAKDTCKNTNSTTTGGDLVATLQGPTDDPSSPTPQSTFINIEYKVKPTASRKKQQGTKSKSFEAEPYIVVTLHNPNNATGPCDLPAPQPDLENEEYSEIPEQEVYSEVVDDNGDDEYLAPVDAGVTPDTANSASAAIGNGSRPHSRDASKTKTMGATEKRVRTKNKSKSVMIHSTKQGDGADQNYNRASLPEIHSQLGVDPGGRRGRTNDHGIYHITQSSFKNIFIFKLTKNYPIFLRRVQKCSENSLD